jgi:hypothetical protein
MGWLLAQIREEPVLFQGIVQAVIALGVSFGLGLTANQVGAISAVSAAILSFLTRQQVTPLSNPKDATGKSLR